MIEVGDGPTRLAHLFLQGDLAGVDVADLLLIRRDQAGIVSVEQALHHLCTLALDMLHLGFPRPYLLIERLIARIAGFPHHAVQGVHHFFGRAEVGEDGLELALQLFTTNGLAAIGASFGLAEVIAVAATTPLRERSRHRTFAASTGDDAPHGEVVPRVLTRDNAPRLTEAFQYALVRFETDQRLVLALHERKPPFGRVHVARVNGPLQKLADLLEMHLTAAFAQEVGKALKVALHLDLTCETTRSESFQNLANDRGLGFIRHEHFAVVGDPLVAVAERLGEHPIAVEQARPHTVNDLLGVLLALVLRDGGEKVLDKNAVGVLTEFNGGRFELTARAADSRAQLDMRLQPTREAADIIDDDDVIGALAVLAKISQHDEHAGTVDHAA